MSLYHEASSHLLLLFQNSSTSSSSSSVSSHPYASSSSHPHASSSSLSSQIYSDKSLKTKPGLVYKLVVEAAKWSRVVSEVVERAGVLGEKGGKLTPQLVVVLVHDLLLTKQGIALPKDHGLRVTIERFKARLHAEFTKARIQAGFPTIEAWRAVIDKKDAGLSNGAGPPRHPRWVRINTLAGLDTLDTAFAGWKSVGLANVCKASSEEKVLARDEHIPHLIALPVGIDVTKTAAYRNGSIIIQDKASCFPAYLLNPTPHDGDIIDACAAPGNKTTHLAALLAEARDKSATSGGSGGEETPSQTVFACERDKGRAQTLAKMTKIANPAAKTKIECLLGQDFLRLSPQDKRFAHVGALLLDPSCSGSGIVKRDAGGVADTLQVRLPSTTSREGASKRPSKASMVSKKRKRKAEDSPPPPPVASLPATNEAEEQEEEEEVISEETTDETADALRTRLSNLSAFQLKIVQHAFAFPAARKVVYSTCSIYAEENEQVVVKALLSPVARERGWRVMRREEQVEGLRKWHVRGDLAETEKVLHEVKAEELEDAKLIAEACIRCEKGTEDGTMGFFVAGFIRDDEPGRREIAVQAHRDEDEGDEDEDEDEEEEWNGIDSD